MILPLHTRGKRRVQRLRFGCVDCDCAGHLPLPPTRAVAFASSSSDDDAVAVPRWQRRPEILSGYRVAYTRVQCVLSLFFCVHNEVTRSRGATTTTRAPIAIALPLARARRAFARARARVIDA